MNKPDTFGHSCDDYHKLIAASVVTHAEKLGRNVDYVEIGTFTGNSAAAVLATGKIRRAVLIDNFSLDLAGRIQSAEKVSQRLAQYAGLFEIMVGDCRKIMPNVNETFDVGFVDGDHAEESCRIDMTNMLPKLNPDGVMFIHDVGNEPFTYLLPVVARFAKDNKLTMILHAVQDGLAELRRKT